MEIATVPEVFHLYDESIISCSQWIDFDLPLSEFGSFANYFIDFIVQVIKTYREKPDQLPDACEKCTGRLNDLLKYAQKNEKHANLIKHVLEILSTINENKEDKMEELTSIATSYYRLFELRLKRAQFDLSILSDKGNSRETSKPLEKLNNYIKNTLSKLKLDDTELDPFLLNPESCNKLISFIRSHTRHYPLCNCQQKVSIYAIPCSCPCYCKECWEAEPSFHNQKVCPRCSKPITEFVEID